MDTPWSWAFALPPTLMLEAEITAEGDGRVFCERCKESFPPGTELKYIRNLKGPTELGRKVCDGCHAYYLNKPTTLRRPQGHGEWMWFLSMAESFVTQWHYWQLNPFQPVASNRLPFNTVKYSRWLLRPSVEVWKIFMFLSKPKWHLHRRFQSNYGSWNVRWESDSESRYVHLYQIQSSNVTDMYQLY